MARIPLAPPATPLTRIAAWVSRRRYGTVLEPLAAVSHNPRVMLAYARYEGSVAKWNRVDPHLKTLAVMASAASIGCAWCMDFGYWVAHTEGLDPAKLRELPRWRDSDAYSPLERRVMAYAEAMSGDPASVTDEMVAGLREDLDDAQLVELTMIVAVENSRARFNSALGLSGQGFTDRCELPATSPSRSSS